MKPELEEIQEHFKNARTIECLNFKTLIDVVYCKNYFYNEESESWVSSSGLVCFWNKEKGYARITRCLNKKNCCKNEI